MATGGTRSSPLRQAHTTEEGLESAGLHDSEEIPHWPRAGLRPTGDKLQFREFHISASILTNKPQGQAEIHPMVPRCRNLLCRSGISLLM